jgi:hypothetical protein
VKQNVDPVEASSSVAVGAEPDVKPKKSRAKKAKAVIEAEITLATETQYSASIANPYSNGVPWTN